MPATSFTITELTSTVLSSHPFVTGPDSVSGRQRARAHIHGARPTARLLPALRAAGRTHADPPSNRRVSQESAR